LAAAKYWVGNIVFPIHEKRKGNVYLQTWHGTPLKRLGFDIEVEGPETLARDNFYRESRNWDYLISANQYSSKIFSRAFRYHRRVLEVGYPHNDILFNGSVSLTKEIREKLKIPREKKIVLYAPTWRDTESTSAWNFSFGLKIDLSDFEKRHGEEYVLLIRTHHLISQLLDCEELPDCCINVSEYDDIQELSLISDILVTDYSSVFYDFAVTRKPVLFFAYDLEQYKFEMRGFYVDMDSEMPGPVLRNSNELLDAITNVDEIEVEYEEKYNQFYDKYCSLEDGSSSSKVVDVVFGESHA
jgi:CDP-glycerol glycerophosphotransferase